MFCVFIDLNGHTSGAINLNTMTYKPYAPAFSPRGLSPAATSYYRDRMHNNAWQAYGYTPSTNQPMMVIGQSQEPHSNGRRRSSNLLEEFQLRKSSYTRHKSLVSHLNRMRAAISEKPHVNIRDLLTKATQDLSIQRDNARYRQSRDWMTHQDAADIESIRSMLTVKGMESLGSSYGPSSRSLRSDLSDMSSQHTPVEAVTILRGHAPKIIKAELPRADEVAPSYQEDVSYRSEQKQSTKRYGNRTWSPTAGSDRSRISSASNKKGKARGKVAWSRDSPRGSVMGTSPTPSEKLLGRERLVATPTPPSSRHASEGSDDEGFLSTDDVDDKPKGIMKDTTKKVPTGDHADEDVIYHGKNYHKKTDQMLKYYIEKESREQMEHIGPIDGVRLVTPVSKTEIPKATCDHSHCHTPVRQTPLVMDKNRDPPRSAELSPRVPTSNRGGGLYLRKRLQKSPWRNSAYSSISMEDVPFIQISNPANLHARQRCQSAGYAAYLANDTDHAAFVRSMGDVESLKNGMQNLKVVGTSMTSSTKSDVTFARRGTSSMSLPGRNKSRNRTE